MLQFGRPDLLVTKISRKRFRNSKGTLSQHQENAFEINLAHGHPVDIRLLVFCASARARCPLAVEPRRGAPACSGGGACLCVCGYVGEGGE